jgi:hypothetical protein
MEGFSFPLQEELKTALQRHVTVSRDHLVRSDQKPGSTLNPLRGTINGPLQEDLFSPDDPGEVVGGMLRMEISLNGKMPKKKEEKEGNPESPSRRFQNREEGPGGQQKQEKEEPLRGNGKAERTRIDSYGISKRYGNERQGNGFAHLRPARVSFFIKAYAIIEMTQDNEESGDLSSGKCLDGVGKMG